MTHHTDTELTPCPFCGGKAYFEIDDDRWQWVECGSCGMQGNRGASLMEDCKPKLAEAWNRRAPAPQAQRVPLTRKQINECSRDAQIAFCLDKQPTYEVALTREVERRHGITQEKQG